MTAEYIVGKDVLLPCIGMVNVRAVRPSGAVEVEDDCGRRWLVQADEVDRAETCTFQPVSVGEYPLHRKDRPHVDFKGNW